MKKNTVALYYSHSTNELNKTHIILQKFKYPLRSQKTAGTLFSGLLRSSYSCFPICNKLPDVKTQFFNRSPRLPRILSVLQNAKQIPNQVVVARGGGTCVFFGWVCAARDSKLAPRSKKKFP